MIKKPLYIGGFFAMTGVILGAFGAHYIKQHFTPELSNSFETGVRYQFYHSFALIAIFLIPFAVKSKKILCNLFTLGTVLFSGSIYLLCLLKTFSSLSNSFLGILTPIGGLFLIASWLYFIFLVKKL